MYSYKPKEQVDLCHFNLASEKDYGVQCVILREAQDIKEYTAHHSTIVKSLYEGRPYKLKDVAFLQVASPGKAFGHFDQEKYKIALVPRAYFKVLEFFQTEWPLVSKHIEADHQGVKSKREWISAFPSITFRGRADVQFEVIVDTTDHLKLSIKVTKNPDIGKSNISLVYSYETLGSIHLPPLAMVKMANDLAQLSTLYNYKEEVPAKKSRQS